MKLFLCLLIASSTLQLANLQPTYERKPGGLKVPPIPPSAPQLKAYQESKKSSINADESTVSITVGEENGFAYTVNGITRSPAKIAVSGEYFNDEIQRYGYARLFLIVEDTAYYAVRPVGNRLDVYVENGYYDQFYFEIYSPHPVRAHDLRIGQYNSSTILATGPSRSSAYYKNDGSTDPTNEIQP